MQSIVCNCEKKGLLYLAFYLQVWLDFFYDTFDNISFQVYAKVSVITFLFIFSLDMFMIFFIGFSGLWNNEIDYSIFFTPNFFY